MTIEELEDKHYSIFEDRGIGNPNVKHTKLSIDFAVSILENINTSNPRDFFLENTIEYFKEYLDETV